MVGILLVLLLAPALWTIMWSVAWLTYKLSKSSPWRLAAGISFVAATFGLIALQFRLLRIFETDNFARSHLLYVVFPDVVPGIILMFYKMFKEENAKKQREAAKLSSLINKGHSESSASLFTPPNNGVQIIEIVNASGILRAAIPPVRNKSRYTLMILIIAIGLINVLGLQFVLNHPIPRLLITPGFEGFMRLIQTMNVLTVGYVLVLAFTGRSTLILDDKNLTIESSLLNITVSRKSFANSNVMGLRYAQWQTDSRSGTVERSGIRFEVGSKTQTFGTLVTAKQAHDLLSIMRSIYSFPMTKEA